MRIVRCIDCRGSVCTCRGVYLPGMGMYLPGVGGPARGVPTWGGGYTCQGVYLPKWVCVPAWGGVVYLPGGVPAGKAPAWRMYLPGDVYLPGGIVPSQGVVPARWDCPCPGGVPAHGGVCQHALRQTHRVWTEWLTDACENITLPQLRKNQLRTQNFHEEGVPTYDFAKFGQKLHEI